MDNDLLKEMDIEVLNKVLIPIISEIGMKLLAFTEAFERKNPTHFNDNCEQYANLLFNYYNKHILQTIIQYVSDLEAENKKSIH